MVYISHKKSRELSRKTLMETIKNIFQLLQAEKYEDIKKKFLLDMISFDYIRDDSHGDTLLHCFFRQFKKLLPVSTLEFLIQCFFKIDHYNNDNKTAVHILLEKHPHAYKHFECFLKGGISFFEKKGDGFSILEYLIKTNNQMIFQCLISRYNLDFIRKFYYDKSLSFAFKYESIVILKQLINELPLNLYSLFEEFLNQVHLPTDEDDVESANYQFFLAIKNSKKKIFQKIFEIHPDEKFITLDMLYHCKDTSFCIYLSKYIKDGEYSKISSQNDQNISPEIFNLVNDINSEVYGSRSIIHQAVRENKIDFIKKIPPMMYDALDYSGNTPLYYAIKCENYEIAKYLIKFGDCDFCHLGKKTTPLHLAVKGRPEILKKMLSYVNKKKYKRKFDINVKDRNQSTPLLAPFFSDPSKSNDKRDINPLCLMMIIDNGADITACDSRGNNILYYTFEHYFDINSDDFTKYILSQKNLTINKDGKKSLLIQLYNQRNQHLINKFHERFEIEPDLLKIVFSKCLDPNIEKPYSLLKKQGKENDYFFECLKTANEKTFNSMLKTIEGLLFYVDLKDNNNVLFILANSYFNSKTYLIQIIITIFKAIIENNRSGFLFMKNKENGDSFLHVAIRRRNNLLIQILLDIYQKKENQIFQNFPENKDYIWSLIKDLFYQKNNEKNAQSSIELGTFFISDFQNVFPSEVFEIFDKEPSYLELENFLKKYQNPNIIQNIEKGEPLIMKYVKYEKFDEDEMIKILELFDSYECDFIQNNENESVALILLKRYFFKALEFLFYHHGVGKYSETIMDIKDDSKNAVHLIDLYNNSKNTIYFFKMYIDSEISQNNEDSISNSIQDLNKIKDEIIMNFFDDPKKEEIVMKFIKDQQDAKNVIDFINGPKIHDRIKKMLKTKKEEIITYIIQNPQNVSNFWELINDTKKEEFMKKFFEKTNEKQNVKNTFKKFQNNEGTKIIIDINLINEEVVTKIIKFSKYYSAFTNFISYIDISEEIEQIIFKTIKESYKPTENDEQFWPLLPVIQRFSTFNLHYKQIFDYFQKILLFETPIYKFFDNVVPFYEEIYFPYHSQFLPFYTRYKHESNQNNCIVDSKGILGSFATILNFFTAYESNITYLIERNLDDSIKEHLSISKEKCHEAIAKILVFSPHLSEFNSIIENKKIVYDIDFDISQLSSCFYQVFVKIVDFNIEYFTPQMKLNDYYLICSEEVLLLASVDSEEVRFLFMQQTSDVFCEVFFNFNESKLKLFTTDGMVEFKQIDLDGDKLKILKNVGELMIQKRLEKLNKLFENEWNDQKNSKNSEEKVIIYISHVDNKTMNIIKYYFRIDRNEDIDAVKKYGEEQIQDNLYKNSPNMMLFSLRS